MTSSDLAKNQTGFMLAFACLRMLENCASSLCIIVWVMRPNYLYNHVTKIPAAPILEESDAVSVFSRAMTMMNLPRTDTHRRQQNLTLAASSLEFRKTRDDLSHTGAACCAQSVLSMCTRRERASSKMITDPKDVQGHCEGDEARSVSVDDCFTREHVHGATVDIDLFIVQT